ncbi:unnamed protein product, partial [marine sediment metagenome]
MDHALNRVQTPSGILSEGTNYQQTKPKANKKTYAEPEAT